MIISLIVIIALFVACWMVYKKLGRQGWECLVPIYNMYVLCQALYGNGWKFLLLCVPLYNIYFAIKLYIDLAHGFHKGTGFGIGLLFLPYIFIFILAFGNAQFGDGQMANTDGDFVSNTISTITTKAKEVASGEKKDDKAIDKINQLNDLKEKGIISEEEYERKKAELIEKI